MKTLIKHASVVLPEGIVETSVLIDGTRIADIDPAIQSSTSTRWSTPAASTCCRVSLTIRCIFVNPV